MDADRTDVGHGHVEPAADRPDPVLQIDQLVGSGDGVHVDDENVVVANGDERARVPTSPPRR